MLQQFQQCLRLHHQNKFQKEESARGTEAENVTAMRKKILLAKMAKLGGVWESAHTTSGGLKPLKDAASEC